MQAEYALQTAGLSFAYDGQKEALRGVSIFVPKGRITAVLGANGCGKSTMLKNIAGLLTPKEGQILVDGRAHTAFTRSELAKKVAVVHQKNTAPPDITVEKLIAIGRTPHRTLFGRGNSAKDKAAVEEAMRLTQTKVFADKPVSALSGGELQRAWLAMALAQETEILLLDEITTYLDVHYQMEMMRLIRQLNAEQGKTVFMILHDINLALQFSDYCILMKDGTVAAQGETAEVMNAQSISAVFNLPASVIRVGEKRYCLF